MNRYRIDNIRIKLEDLENSTEREAIKKQLKVNIEKINDFHIIKRSLDSRFHKTKGIFYVYSIDLRFDGQLKGKHFRKWEESSHSVIPQPYTKQMNHKPIIVGTGPSGLFAALRLLEYGIAPILIERGEDVPQRNTDIEAFWKKGQLNTESNIQFGLGGAGTFSDGKLNTRTKSMYISFVLDELVKFGADQSILIDNKPHLGTDNLKKIVSMIKDHLIKNGCEIRFSSKLTDLSIEKNRIQSITVNDDIEMPCDNLFLAIGNSARDTFSLLQRRNIAISAKPFAVGVRVEHPQGIINQYTYGKYRNHPMLGSAEYQLTFQDKETNRAVYSFCNCPGGVVVNATSERNTIAINGMSYSKRNLPNANSAIVATVSPDDFIGNDPLSGVHFQRELEQKAFLLGGEAYKAPMMLISDYLNIANKSANLTRPSILPGTIEEDINRCFPDSINRALKHALHAFIAQIPGFEDGVMTAVETRTSSPVRILRDPQTMQSVNTIGLYPIGEGAGYAGGIMSSAVDGVKLADIWIKQHV